MPIGTFFSGPPDTGLSDISRAMLQDEANRNTATANQANFFATLAGQRSQERQSQGRDRVFAGQTESNERVAGLPYRSMTPAQAGQLELEKRKQKFFEDHPELFGSDKSRIAGADRAAEMDQLTRESEAAAAMANSVLNGAKAKATQTLAGKIKGWSFGPFSKGVLSGDQSKADTFAGLVAAHKLDVIPKEVRDSEAFRKAKDEFDAEMVIEATKAQQALGKNALLIRINPDTMEFDSVYSRGGGGGAMPSPPQPGPVAAPGPVSSGPAPVVAPAAGSGGGYFAPGGWGAFRGLFGGGGPPTPLVAASPAVAAPITAIPGLDPSQFQPAPMIMPTNRPGFFAAPVTAPRAWVVDPSGRLIPK